MPSANSSERDLLLWEISSTPSVVLDLTGLKPGNCTVAPPYVVLMIFPLVGVGDFEMSRSSESS